MSPQLGICVSESKNQQENAFTKSLLFTLYYTDRINSFNCRACHYSDKACCQYNLYSHYYFQWESTHQITWYLVIWGTSVTESVCNCCIGRWLRSISTLSSALQIRISGSIVKTCQHFKGGVHQTSGSTTHLGTQAAAWKQFKFLRYTCG